MKTDTWMPLYIGDYLGDTMDLNTEQHGAYLLILMAYWRNRGPLADDDEQFCRVTGLMRDAWRSHRQRIAKFFQIDGGLWRHKRVDLELAKALHNKESRVSAATKAAFARWNPDGSRVKTCMRDASVKHTPSPSPSPSELSLPPGARDAQQEPAIQGREILSLEKVKAAVMTTGIPDGFVEMVYDSWLNRSGRDGAGVDVEIVAYVGARWKREATDWRNGTHRGSNLKGANGAHKPNNRQGVNRNQGTLNDPSRYSAANIAKLKGGSQAQQV